MRITSLKQAAEQVTPVNAENRLSLESLMEAIDSLLPTEAMSGWDLVGQRYPQLSLEFLQSQTPEGFPRFVMFHPKSSVFKLQGQYPADRYTFEFDPFRFRKEEGKERNRECRSHYKNLQDKLNGIAENTWRSRSWRTRGEIVVHVKQQFTGLIPSEVRREIKALQGVFEEGTPYIIAEAGEWQVDVEVVTKRDPLVVLIPHWPNAEFGYLVAAFDVSTTEDYVQREFKT